MDKSSLNSKGYNLSLLRIKRLAKNLYTILVLIRRYHLRLNLNQSKFETRFLNELSQFIGKYYGKKVEFHVVNLKNIVYNGDIFTQILTSKIKNPKRNPSVVITQFLNKVKLPVEGNRIKERGRVEKTVDLNLVLNKYKNLNISSILSRNNFLQDNLNKLIYNLNYKPMSESENNLDSWLEIRDLLFEAIKYKAIGGIRLIVKGRLTRRYRADRALNKLA
jgi:hypothetical protein